MNLETQETLRQNDDATNKILQAIAELSRETTRQIGDMRRESNERFTKLETDVEEIKKVQFSLDVQLRRVLAMAHDALNIGNDLQADMMIVKAEVSAWAKDVNKLNNQFI
jgi:predicted translin family RNA/ssDNA-binding protein